MGITILQRQNLCFLKIKQAIFKDFLRKNKLVSQTQRNNTCDLPLNPLNFAANQLYDQTLINAGR